MLSFHVIRNIVVVMVLSVFMTVAGSAGAAEFFLRADTVNKVMADGQSVPMWGFALDSAFGAHDGTVTVPGPALNVPAGDTTLTIHLENNLPEPVSVMIPGQIAVMTPVKFTDGQGRDRIRSMTHETPSGNVAPVDYVWNNLRHGTYLYQSASHPAVQVQMGLYGAVTRDLLTMNLQAAQGFNMVILDDAYHQKNVVEGNAAVGDHAWFYNFGIGTGMPPGDGVLAVGGSLDCTTVIVGSSVLNPATYGDMYVYATPTVFSNVYYDRLITGDHVPFDFRYAENYFRQAAAYWGSLAANGTTTPVSGTLNLDGADPSLNIFSVASATLAGARQLNITTPAGSTVLVNVSGAAPNMHDFMVLLYGPTADKILYNFYEAATLTIDSGDPQGSVLAPDAAVSFDNGTIHGIFVAKALGTPGTPSEGAVFNVPFTGDLPALTTKQAYEGFFYDTDAVVLFSEVDPALHQAVATGNYGPGMAMTSTMDYNPYYFLINGQSYAGGAVPALANISPDERLLLRLINAGIETHVPVLQYLRGAVVAEDGHLLAYTRDRYGIPLTAAKTKDLLVTPTMAGTYALYDRRLRLTNGASTAFGGMLGAVDVAAPAPLGTLASSVTLIEMAEQWLFTGCADCSADLDGDQIVNFRDFALLVQQDSTP